ncbi:MAG: competence protein ComEC family protein [Kiritimatiellaeota bacterium]|nr:competence protein ComEC family protein [Kiritimatiellota bacterium]
MCILTKVFQWNRRQPLLAVTVLFLAGVGIGYRFPSVNVWLCAAGFGLCLAWVAVRREALRVMRVNLADTVILILGVLFAGMGRVAWDTRRIALEADTLRALDTRQSFVCRVISAPTTQPLTGLGARYTFDVDRVAWRDGGRDFRTRRIPVTVSWYGSVRDERNAPRPGETWQVSGRIRVVTKRNGLDHAYLSFSKGDTRSRKLSAATGTWLGRLTSLQREAVRRVALGVEDWGVVPVLNQAMLLGNRNEMPEEMRRVFAASGTIHVFAISGLHIALVASVFVFFTRLTGLSRLSWVYAVVPLLIVYTLVTGARPSAVRACCMAACMLLAPLLGRRPDGLAALLATALVFHLWQPSLITNAGSVLSFSVMAGLIVFVPHFSAILRRWLGYHALQNHHVMLKAAGTDVRWRGWGITAVRYVADVLAVSVAAWLVSVPLTGYYFGRVPIGGLLANPVVTSCAFLVITAGFLGMLAGLFSAWVAVCFNNAAGFFTMIMVRTAEAVASVKVLSLETGNWAGWAVTLWFAALAALAVWLHTRKRTDDGLEWLEGGA